jgi:hypothetical protein
MCDCHETMKLEPNSPGGIDPVEAERQRCIAVCEGWIGTFQDKEIQFTSAREYAVDAIEDIIDLIRNGPASPANQGPK